VVATAKTADLILIMLDATKSDEQRRLLEIELDAVGIRRKLVEINCLCLLFTVHSQQAETGRSI
jgi:ribosome-interacting GTPase 1